MGDGTQTRSAPVWQTIDGMIYMTQTGGAEYLDPLQLLDRQYQVGAKKTYNEHGQLENGNGSQKWLSRNEVEFKGSDESDFIHLEKGAHTTAYGGGGNDTIKGGRLSDTIYGGDGNDYVRGGGGDDVVHGDAGNDRVTGAGGNDTLRGGTGDDFLFGGKGTDIMYGEQGDDVFYLKIANNVNMQDFENAPDSADAIMDFEHGSDRIRLKSGSEVFFQHVTINDEIYTFLFNNDQGDGATYGVIHGQHIDLTMRDFENAGKVVQMQSAEFKSAVSDEVAFPEFNPNFLTLASVGEVDLM